MGDLLVAAPLGEWLVEESPNAVGGWGLAVQGAAWQLAWCAEQMVGWLDDFVMDGLFDDYFSTLTPDSIVTFSMTWTCVPLAINPPPHTHTHTTPPPPKLIFQSLVSFVNKQMELVN